LRNRMLPFSLLVNHHANQCPKIERIMPSALLELMVINFSLNYVSLLLLSYRWYAWWESSQYFVADVASSKPPFVMVSPLPWRVHDFIQDKYLLTITMWIVHKLISHSKSYVWIVQTSTDYVWVFLLSWQYSRVTITKYLFADPATPKCNWSPSHRPCNYSGYWGSDYLCRCSFVPTYQVIKYSCSCSFASLHWQQCRMLWFVGGGCQAIMLCGFLEWTMLA
jgi:hypothetical protein